MNQVKSTLSESLAKEVAFRGKLGYIQITMEELLAKLRAIGYRFDRGMDCKATSVWQTGERAGESYPANNLYPVQTDDGVSAFNVDARRDKNYEALKAIRNQYFAVASGYLVEF